MYLDYAASTPLDSRVWGEMSRILEQGIYANPGSPHAFGAKVAEIIEGVRGGVLGLYELHEHKCIFTSGATESINLALLGYNHPDLKQVLVVESDHKAALSAQELVMGRGQSVISVDRDGFLLRDDLVRALKRQRSLLSVSHVNNETGVAEDIAEIASIVHSEGSLLHVDAAQSFGKWPEIEGLRHADMISISAHKFYGPKGIGALIVRPELIKFISSRLVGGAQEEGLRAGTLPTHQIIGIGAAVELAKKEMKDDWDKATAQKKALLEWLGRIEGLTFNGAMEGTSPFILNVSIDGIDGEVMLFKLRDFCLSRVSACNSGSLSPSHVLRAMYGGDERVEGGFRISLGKYTTWEHIERLSSRLHAEARGCVDRML